MQVLFGRVVGATLNTRPQPLWAPWTGLGSGSVSAGEKHRLVSVKVEPGGFWQGFFEGIEPCN